MIDMAILKLPTGYFELIPQHVTEEWIQTYLALEIVVRGEKLLLNNKHKISLQSADYSRLISSIRKFIHSRVNVDNSDANVEFSTGLAFTPLEMHFVFVCLDGEIGADLEGEITLRIMVNLEIIDSELSSSYIGGVFNVEANSLIAFVQNLEDELVKSSPPA